MNKQSKSWLEHLKWWLNWIGTVILVVLCVVYLIIRPIFVQNAGPMIQEALADHINGTITWEAFDLDPSLNLDFTNVTVSDAAGSTVLKTPDLTISWSTSTLTHYLIHKDGILNVFTGVKVDHPDLSLVQEPDGRWNVDHLLKPSSNTPQGEFNGNIAIAEGNTKITLQDGNSFAFTGLNLNLNPAGHQKYTGTFDGVFSDAHFKGSLDFQDQNHYSGSLSTDPVKLHSLEPLFNALPSSIMHSVQINEGTGEITSAKVWKNNGALSYRIQGCLEHAALSIDDYALADGAAFFDITNGVASLSEMKAKINGQSVQGDAAIDFNQEPYLIRGKIFCDHVNLEKIMPDKGISGILTGTFSLAGTTDRPQVSGDAQVENISANGFSAKRVQGSFDYGDSVLHVPAFYAQVADGRIWGSGFVKTDTQDYQCHLDMDHVQLAGLPLNQDISGVISGSLSASGTYSQGQAGLHDAEFSVDGSQLSMAGNYAGNLLAQGHYDGNLWNIDFTMHNANMQGAQISDLTGKVSTDLKSAVVHTLNGEMNEGGSFTISGRYNPDSMDLSLSAVNIDSAVFSHFLPVPVSGALSGNLALAGSLDDPEINGNIHLADGSINGFKFSDLSSQLNTQNGALEIQARCSTQNGTHSILGTIGLNGDHELNLKIDFNHVRLEDLLPLAHLSYPATGWLNNSLTVRGTMKNPVITGDFMAWDGSINKYLYQNISGQYTYNKGVLTLQNGMAFLFDGTALFNGTLDGQNLNFDVSCTDVSIGKILPALGAQGLVSLRGHLSGTVGDPAFEGILSSRSVTMGQGKVSYIATGLSYQNGMISLHDGSFYQGKGTFTCKGGYNIFTGSLAGNITFNNWDVPTVLKFFNIPVRDVSGTMNGSLSVSGTTDHPNIILKADIAGGHLGHTYIGQGSVDLSYVNDALTIRTLRIPVGSGLLAVKGTMSKEGDLAIEAAANQIDISWIPTILGRNDLIIGGELTGAVNITGNKKRPKADVSLTVDHPRYGDFVFDSASLLGNVQDGLIHLNQVLLSRDPYRGSAKGQIPVGFFIPAGNNSNDQFDFTVNLDKADLSALALFFKPVTSASGPITGTIHVQGPAADPEIYGKIGIEQGRLTFVTMDDPVLLTLNTDFNGKSADVSSAAALGGGSADLKGTFAWDHAKLSNYSGEFHMHTPSFQSTYYKGAVDADLSIQGGMPGIGGAVDIHDATMNIPFSLLSNTGSLGLAVPLNVNVNVKDNVRLYDPSLYEIMLHGNIEARGTLADPFMSGMVTADSGTLKVNTTEFNLTDGHAVWGGLPGSFLPVLHLKAESKIGHYTVIASLNGPPNNLKTEFTSSPHLNDSQILMLLALREDPNSENSSANEGALFNAGLTLMFGNGIQDFMRDKIGLDYMSITSDLTDYYDSNSANDNNNYYYIKIGKYLFNDFMLIATMGMNNDDKSIGARYKLNSHAGIAAWRTSNHDSYIGADWDFRF